MDRKLIFVPMELRKDGRSFQLYQWLIESFGNAGVQWTTIGDVMALPTLGIGQEPDPFDLNYHRAGQLLDLLDELSSSPADKFSVLFMDLYFPGIEAVAHLRDAGGLDVKIVGFIDANEWTGTGPAWEKPFQKGVIRAVDVAYVDNRLQKNIVEQSIGTYSWHKVKVMDYEHGADFARQLTGVVDERG